jgi:DNA polymerase
LARLPAGLGQAAACLGLPPKDEAGKKLVLSLSKRDLTANPVTDAERAIADAYVRQDTELCRLIDRRVPEIPEQWRAVFEFDYELNERGLPLDVPTIEKLLVVRDAETKRLQAQFATLTDGGLASPKQNKKLKAKLATLGVNLPNLQHHTLERWTEENPRRNDLAAKLIRTALEWSHSSDAKLDRMVAAAHSTGRARDLFVLHGAHTGRWAGRNMQPQNLPKNVLDDPEATLKQLLDRADGILAGTVNPMRDPGWMLSIKGAIAGCLRSLIKAPDGWMIVSCDFGQIESRVLCWIAGQQDKLDAYREGRDVYTLEAQALGSDSRDLGKLFVLSAGYGASGRVMFTKAPGFNVVLTESEGYELTDRWRENNADIVAFWNALYATLCYSLELPAGHAPIAFRGLCVWRDDTMLYVQLPCGRTLKYRNPVMELDDRGFAQITVQLPKGKKLLPVSIWHGSVTENVVSGIAYDVLVEKMLRLHRDGVFIVGTIHDEIIALAPVEGAEAIRDHMIKVMQEPPAWAPDLPLAADGYVNQRFTKPSKPTHAPLSPSSSERWMNCPGSMAAVQALPPAPESAFAAEGTEAHRIFAHCLETGADPVTMTTDFMVLQPLRLSLAITRDLIGGRKFKIEARLDPIPGIEKVWGTADVLVFDPHTRIEEVIDLKFGASVTIEPDALQIQLYGLLATQQYGCDSQAGIRLHVIQPRRQHPRGPHRTHHLYISDLKLLYASLQKAVEAIETPGAPRVPGDWCRFCPARQGCPEALSAARRERKLVNPFGDRRFG